jgi:hypothetical protein
MPAPKNLTLAKTVVAKHGLDHTDLNRIVSEDEAAWRRGVSPDTLRRHSERTGKPRRFHLSARRVGYLLREVLEM